MSEIIDERPNIPKEPTGPPRRRPPSAATRAATRSTPQPATGRQVAATPQPGTGRRVAATPQPRGGAASGLGATRVVDRGDPSRRTAQTGIKFAADRPTPKGTYLFVDSGAYRGPPRQQPEAPPQGIGRGSHGDRYGGGHPDDMTMSYRRSQPVARNLHGTLERSVQFADQRRSSEDDFLLVLEEMSDLVAPHDSDEQENASDQGSDKNVTEMPPRQKSYKDIVRVQRPEIIRRRDASPRKPKTYTEMLQEMKAEAGSSREPSSADVKAKQRLYGMFLLTYSIFRVIMKKISFTFSIVSASYTVVINKPLSTPCQ